MPDQTSTYAAVQRALGTMEVIARILKTRFPNLSVEDVIKIAGDIVAAITPWES
jgi:hypothetical protein